MAHETWYDEDGKAEDVYVKEEPDCYTCTDSRQIWVDTDGAQVPTWKMLGDRVEFATLVNCPDCSPTQQQLAVQMAEFAKRDAEFAAKVARGEASYDDEPAF